MKEETKEVAINFVWSVPITAAIVGAAAVVCTMVASCERYNTKFYEDQHRVEEKYDEENVRAGNVRVQISGWIPAERSVKIAAPATLPDTK